MTRILRNWQPRGNVKAVEMAKTFDELVKRTTKKRTRDRAARRTRELLSGLLLSEVRTLSGRTQRQLADALGIRQPSLSKLEHQSDMQVSTLQRIVAALGGELELVARFPTRAVKLAQFQPPRQSTHAAKPRSAA